MISSIPNRADALDLLKKYNKTESLIYHALAVEGVMRHFAAKNNENPDEWGIVGLLHDLDYEMYPDQHCHKTEEILKEANYDSELIRAIMSHGWGIVTDIEPITLMEKTLFTIDELTGLITACAYVRPSKSVMDMEVSSVKKKWKQKSFAAGASRETILKGIEILGMDLDSIIFETIEGMKSVAKEIGL